MGLKNGKDGVKFSLRRKYDLAFGLFPNYAECVEAFKQTPADVILVVDGNVLLRQLPRLVGRDGTENLPAHNAPAELDDYVQILTGRFHAFFRAANTVVLVFDEPQTITMAKQEEQSKRDGSSKQVKASSDFKLNTDRYTLRDMKLADPLHDLVKGRAARPRFSDQVIRMVKQKLAPFLRLNKKSLVVDGADPRGALREVGSLRAPRITAVGHDAVAMARWFCNYAHCGEGDLKLARMYERVLAAHGNDAAPESLRAIRTYFSFTIDGTFPPGPTLSVEKAMTPPHPVQVMNTPFSCSRRHAATPRTTSTRPFGSSLESTRSLPRRSGWSLATSGRASRFATSTCCTA